MRILHNSHYSPAEIELMSAEERREKECVIFAHGSTDSAAERYANRGLLSVDGLRLVQLYGLPLKEALRRYPEFAPGQRVAVNRGYRGEYSVHTVRKVDARRHEIDVYLDDDRYSYDRHELVTEYDIENDIDYRIARDPELKARLLATIRGDAATPTFGDDELFPADQPRLS